MRLHANDCKSTDLLLCRLSREAKIFVNGVQFDNVIWADEGTGQIERYLTETEKQERIERGEYNHNMEWPTVVEDGYVEIRDPMGQHVRKPYEAIGNGKNIKYTIARSYVDKCSKHGIDAVAEARSIWGNEIEIEVVDQLELDKDGNTV